MSTISYPQEFPGTAEERQANYDSHSYYYTGGPEDGDVRCDGCDCRPYSTSAQWPCGAEVPRVTVERSITHDPRQPLGYFPGRMVCQNTLG